MNKITKAVIPCAGMGTRFLPATKSIPKEMIPIIDKPTIQFIIEEAINSGIKEILLVVSSTKNAIIDHFDYSPFLDQNLKIKNKCELQKDIENISNLINIQYIRQKKPLGLGDAIMLAKNFVGKDYFAVLLGDDVFYSKSQNNLALKECINAYNKYKSTIIGIQHVDDTQVSKYGIVDIENRFSNKNNVFLLKGMVEKPNISNKPSNYAIMGRYILSPKIFEELQKQDFDKSNEIQLTPAIERLCKKQKVFGKILSGKRYDLGSKLGFVIANIDFGLRNSEINTELKEYIKSIKKINDDE